MKITSKLITLAILLALAITGCKKKDLTEGFSIVTEEVQEITSTSAKFYYSVTVPDNIQILAVEFNLWKAPDTYIGSLEPNLSYGCFYNLLEPNTEYIVQAVAYTFEKTKETYPTFRGEKVSFTTLYEGGVTPTPPIGALNGIFTVSESSKVRFARGNLQYQASTDSWRFAERQTVYIGEGNANISANYSGWIDLFGWGTSGYNHGATCYQPWSISTVNADYAAYGDYLNNLFDGNGQADWGYNAIDNGGNQMGLWRTPTSREWDYLLTRRDTPSGIRFAVASVDGTNGLVIFPDDWDASLYSINMPNRFATEVFTVNVISASDWLNIFENAGAAFLPAAGVREGTSLHYMEELGGYWASTNYNSYASYFGFAPIEGGDPQGANDRGVGCSVRLVRTIE